MVINEIIEIKEKYIYNEILIDMKKWKAINFGPISLSSKKNAWYFFTSKGTFYKISITFKGLWTF